MKKSSKCIVMIMIVAMLMSFVPLANAEDVGGGFSIDKYPIPYTSDGTFKLSWNLDGSEFRIRIYGYDRKGNKETIWSETSYSNSSRVTLKWDSSLSWVKSIEVVAFISYRNGRVETTKSEIIPVVIPIDFIYFSVYLYDKEVMPGAKFSIDARILPSNPTNPTLLYYSSDESVATVDEQGVVTAHQPGTTRIEIVAADGYGESAGFTMYVVNPRTPGDADEDGAVGWADLILMLKHVSGWSVSINTENADVTADSAVGWDDLILLLKYVSGWNVGLK